jgi:predicted DNA-binding transcriptional regulator AlpA
MKIYSTREAAKKLGIDMSTLSRYISLKKVPEPKSVTSGGMTIHLWSETEIEEVRKLLPKIANGRKTRYQKKHSTKTKAQPRAAVPHKTRKPKKK